MVYQVTMLISILTSFFTMTQSMKQNGVTHDVLRLCLFPYYLTHHATAWFDCIPKNFIHGWEEMVTKFLSKYFSPSIVTILRNDISNFRQLLDESLFEAWERYKLSIDPCPNHNMLPITQIYTFYNGLTLRHWDTINAVARGTFMKSKLMLSIQVVRLVVIHIIIPNVNPPVASLSGTYMLLQETTMHE
ncbi:reverse transcriptase domain-containing protein, partial [Tanacetum coccineum]